MGISTLEPAHRLLVCLAVATRAHDPVLVTQIAEKADRTLSPKEMKRTFGRLAGYCVDQSDMAWLQSADL